MYPYDRLVKTRVDDVRRSAALYRHAVQARPPRTPQRRRLTTAPVRLVARIRALNIRPASSRPQPSA
jgi:hypothetical protein